MAAKVGGAVPVIGMPDDDDDEDEDEDDDEDDEEDDEEEEATSLESMRGCFKDIWPVCGFEKPLSTSPVMESVICTQVRSGTMTGGAEAGAGAGAGAGAAMDTTLEANWSVSAFMGKSGCSVSG